jgi:ubiquinone biosynthesis protein UbiJ
LTLARSTYTIAALLSGGEKMAKSRLTKVAESIGGAIGKADRTAHKVAKAGVLAKKELEALSKEVDSLKKRLQKTTKRLKHALS